MVEKEKKRGGVETPSFKSLGERMAQGGYGGHSVENGLAKQMYDEDRGYKAGFKCKSLGELMGQ